MTLLLLLVVLIPFAAAIVAAFVPPVLTRRVAVAAAFITALLAIGAAWSGYPNSYSTYIAGMSWLGAGRGNDLFGVLLDPLGTVLLIVASVLGFLTVLYSTRYLRLKNREHGVGEADQARFYFWLLAFMGSMVGVATAPNFLQLFVFWELTTMCSWALISYYRSDKSLRAGFKAILMTHAGSIFFLFALLIMFARTGSFAFDAPTHIAGPLRGWVYAFMLIAAWAKAAQVPFHTWLPDAMEAPTPISAYLHAAAMVKAGVFLMARAVSGGWMALPQGVGTLMASMALFTILVALTFYFIQDDLKRLLAYSTIAHLGYILLGISLGTMGSTIGFQGGVLHLFCHAFSKATLFFAVGAVAYITGSRSISQLGGVAKVMPLTATAYFIGVLAVTGIPPFACFWSKFMIVAGALQIHGALGPGIVVFVLTESLIAFGWMLHVGQKVFFGAQTELARVNSDPPPAMSITLVLLMIACIVAPLVGIPLIRWIGG